MNIFEQANDVNKKVAEGEITGAVTWPLEGQARLMEVKSEFKKGNPYLAFKLAHDVKGTQVFLVRLPTHADKDSAKFMGMQRIYATLFSAAQIAAGSQPPEAVFNALVKDIHENGEIPVQYTLTNYETLSQQTGKTFTNQSLEALAVVLDDCDMV